MYMFIAILTVGFIYELSLGVIDLNFVLIYKYDFITIILFLCVFVVFYIFSFYIILIL